MEGIKNNLLTTRLNPSLDEMFKRATSNLAKYSRPPPPLRKTPVYIRATMRPIGELRRKLREYLPAAAVLNMDVIGKTTLETLRRTPGAVRFRYAMNKFAFRKSREPPQCNHFRLKQL